MANEETKSSAAKNEESKVAQKEKAASEVKKTEPAEKKPAEKKVEDTKKADEPKKAAEKKTSEPAKAASEDKAPAASEDKAPAASSAKDVNKDNEPKDISKASSTSRENEFISNKIVFKHPNDQFGINVSGNIRITGKPHDGFVPVSYIKPGYGLVNGFIKESAI